MRFLQPPMQRGEGFHAGSSVNCQAGALKSTSLEKLEPPRKNPDRCAGSELRQARNFVAGRYRL
jgi:hypothetical protein